MKIHEVSISDAYAWRSRCISLLMMVQTSSALTKRPSYRLNAFSTTLREFHGGASSALHSRWPMEWFWWFLVVLKAMKATRRHLAKPTSCASLVIFKLRWISFLPEFWVFRLRVFKILRKHQIARRMVYVRPLNSQRQPRSRKVHRHRLLNSSKKNHKSSLGGL